MARKRTKVTPRWLSLTRSVYAYITGSSLISMTLENFGWTPQGILTFIGWWGVLGVAIQFGCDTSDENKKIDPIKPQ